MAPRLLFVVSGAYGDLSLAAAFVYGQELNRQTAIALPKKLHSANHDSLPLQVYRYTSVEGILRAATMWEARIVFLLSAYGFPLEGLTSPAGVGRLVQSLRDQNCTVLTSDPFLGRASTLLPSELQRMLPPSAGWLDRRVIAHAARRIARVLNTSSNVLRDVTHLYPMPIDNLVNHGRLKRTCFFNPGLMRRDSEWDDPAGGDETQAHVNLSERTWLFVLSSDDVSVQQYQWGRAKFAHQMVHLLEQTRAARRRPVLVGPPSFIKNVRRALPSSLECELVQFCSYREFASRLVSAEYAFYWNALSCSAALVRLVRRLPVFFFARGHVAQISKEIYADGLRCYYGGWEPTQLERGELDPDVLAVLAADQRRAVDALLEYWGHAPTPRQLIDGLLQDSIVQPSAG